MGEIYVCMCMYINQYIQKNYLTVYKINLLTTSYFRGRLEIFLTIFTLGE